MKSYWKAIYESRFFWSHLAKIDLKNKFRRTKIGVLWLGISPLCLTLIMVTVFGTAFHIEYGKYAAYILSGVLFWNIMTDSFISGASSIVGSEAYIKQFNHPIIIYPLKTSLTGIMSFVISLLALLPFSIMENKSNIFISIIMFLPSIVVYFFLEWFCTIISAFVCTKYRDYPQLAALLLQTLWYLSPVFFQESMFESNKKIHSFFEVNPITHLLELTRAPLLYGKLPTCTNYLISVEVIVICGFFAWILNKKDGKNIVFYI